jgi:lipoprotein-anchoring transpeptidase ErfK/SrfK
LQIAKSILKFLLFSALIYPLAGCGLLHTSTPSLNGSQTEIHQIDTEQNANSNNTANSSTNHQTPAKPEQQPQNPPKPPMISPGNHSDTALYLNEALAELNYLPVTFTPNLQPNTITKNEAFAKAALQEKPLPGKFTWKYPAIASTLQAGWSASTMTTLSEGALMTYQHNRGLAVDGIAGPQVWNSLRADIAAHHTNPNGYMYITVEKRQPQTLKVWRDNKIVYTSLVNTGIASAPSDNGTWPIYLRYTSQTMQGVDPSGHHYYDPGVPYVNYYHGGEAVHGFVRSSYGWPQSLGCVELPVQNAKAVFSLVTYGTLVTVCNKLPKS